VQTGWVARLALPGAAGIAGFVVLVALELAIPYWAESAGRTPWHPGHIAERYGLFTLIVLGESVLSATVGVQTALDTTSTFAELAPVITGGILIVFFMWWMYFDMPGDQVVERARDSFMEGSLRGPFLWGYGHYLVFAAAAAAGAGLSGAKRLRVDAGKRQQARGGGGGALVQQFRIVGDCRWRSFERPQHGQRPRGAAARRVDRKLRRRAQTCDAIAGLSGSGESLAPLVGFAFGERVGRDALDTGFVRVDPGREVGRAQVGKAQKQVREVAFGIDGQDRHAVHGRLFDQPNPKARLAAARHSQDDGVRDEVTRVVE
jgi:hypothetical protein